MAFLLQDSQGCLNLLNYALDKLLLLLILVLHLSTFILKFGFRLKTNKTYKWILYTLVNVTQLGPVDGVQLNIKMVTDWLMEDGATLGRRLCGRNDTPLVTVSEVNAITLSNSELASRISFIPPISAFEIIPTAYSYERRLLVHVRSRREVWGTGCILGHPHQGKWQPG